MKHGWVLAFFPWFLHGAETVPEALFPAPKAFPPSHYGILQEYSPFVKSLESAKEMEKSPDLVVVGYGRMKGEDQVIVQMKENSEKREKIGSRYGSKDFPYRLLSVTNTSDRKTFVAVLEDRNKKKHQIRYASESVSPAGTALVATGGGQSPGGGMGGSGNAAGLGQPGSPSREETLNFPGVDTPQSLLAQIQILQARLKDPATTDTQRQNMTKAINIKQQKLNILSPPQEVNAPPVTPEVAP